MNPLAVRLRRLSTELRDRMAVVPLAFVVAALVASQLTLAIDRDLGDDALPRILETTVDSADSILSTIAGGLISAITLLLSLVLLAVQLASSQFSPRTVQDWIGDRTQQRAIGLVLGTTVFCLMVLRETQTVGDSFALAPHVSVLVAVALAVISLVSVVRSVDHLSNSMKVGSVARSLAQETLESLQSLGDRSQVTATEAAPAAPIARLTPLETGHPLLAARSGWVQQVLPRSIAAALPEGGRASVVAASGTFVVADQPLAWLEGQIDGADQLADTAFTIGDTRLVDHDPSYGLLQMSDIALRALSPGVNDPNTACDVVVHMGMVLIEAWKQPVPSSQLELDSRIVDFTVADQQQYLHLAFSQVLRYATNEYDVLATLIRTMHNIRTEVVRRELPGPIEPLDEMVKRISDTVNGSDLVTHDKQSLIDLLDQQDLDVGPARR